MNISSQKIYNHGNVMYASFFISKGDSVKNSFTAIGITVQSQTSI